MPEDFFDELIGKKSDELDDILDKIKNRWDTDLTLSLWDEQTISEEREDEEPPKRNVPQRANRSRKKQQRYRNRK